MNIEHIAIYTYNLDDSKKFYCTYFGFKAGKHYRNGDTQFESYFLTADEGVRLELMWRPGLKDTAVNNGELCGLSHFAISLGSTTQVEALYTRLVQNGAISISPPRRTGDGYYEACIEDPDGNRIELTV